MKRYLLLSMIAGLAQAAEPEAVSPVQSALAACAAMQERFVGTECTATPGKSGVYRVEIKAATPDAMRVVFMRSLDVADLLCGAGHKVDLSQELQTSEGPRVVLWQINPPDCGIARK